VVLDEAGKETRVTIEVRMPQMGESIAEGTLVKWHKKVGDRVKRDETLFEISTDKVDTEVPSEADGYLVDVLVKEGETVPVHSVVCILGDAPAGTGRPAAAREAPPTAAAPAGRPAPAPAAKGASPPGGDRLREKSSPLVRRLAAEHGIDITGIRGTGISGRVTKEDILRHIESGASGSRAVPEIRRTPAERAGPAAGPETAAEDRVEPMSVMRQRIAEHMVLSRRTSAHVSSVFEVDMTAVRALKDSLAKDVEERHGARLTYMPFIINAVAAGLRRFPALNASIEGKDVRYHGRVHIGVAVALEQGLIVPVIRDADAMGIIEITLAVNDLARRAREKQLKPEEVQGGTFTITNPGVFGSMIGTPIIHQPQVGILCVGAVTKRAVVLPDTDAIAIRSMAFLSLTFDHRLIDGATADRFLAGIKAALEECRFPDPLLAPQEAVAERRA
jgi:2-oxoglutarate dehydrogenase E2 component (dihydrolipoamide succinyltransferase)